jgi:hypothetical protein
MIISAGADEELVDVFLITVGYQTDDELRYLSAATSRHSVLGSPRRSELST